MAAVVVQVAAQAGDAHHINLVLEEVHLRVPKSRSKLEVLRVHPPMFYGRTVVGRTSTLPVLSTVSRKSHQKSKQSAWVRWQHGWVLIAVAHVSQFCFNECIVALKILQIFCICCWLCTLVMNKGTSTCILCRMVTVFAVTLGILSVLALSHTVCVGSTKCFFQISLIATLTGQARRYG